MYLDKNRFKGEIDLTCLPPSIREIYLGETELCGEPDFTKLPEGLQVLDLSFNKFGWRGDIPALVRI